MITVGFSQNTETRAAMHAALRECAADAHTTCLLVFCGRHHAPETVLASVRQELGDIPVYGGSCVGAISADSAGYSGFEIIIAAFDATAGEPQVCVAGPLEDNEAAVGAEIGRWLESNAVSGAMLLYDLTRVGGGVNVGTFLLDGIYSSLSDDNEPMLFGAGLLADFPLRESFVFDGKGIAKNVALAIALPARLKAHVQVMHGCAPVSRIMRVTAARGARVLELEGEPAADVLHRMVGTDDAALAFSVLLGRSAGEVANEFDETEFINRLIIDVDRRDGSVGLFETDIKTGDEVQVMVRDNHLLMESVSAGASRCLENNAGKRPVAAFYVDCAGRASVFTGSEEEEAARLTSHLGGCCPLLGFYAGREIAPFAGRARPLDWTGVLVMLTEDSGT